MLGAVRKTCDAAYQAIIGYHERLASRSAYRTKVPDGKAWRRLCYCKSGEQAARGYQGHD
jgi:hypothetical protein